MQKNDLKRTDIEDIERHLWNYKLLVKFLKDERKYFTFKRILFDKYERSMYDLFELINVTRPAFITFETGFQNKTDAVWSHIFSNMTFVGDWRYDNLIADDMIKMCLRWAKFLKENNFDKQKDI